MIRFYLFLIWSRVELQPVYSSWVIEQIAGAFGITHKSYNIVLVIYWMRVCIRLHFDFIIHSCVTEAGHIISNQMPNNIFGSIFCISHLKFNRFSMQILRLGIDCGGLDHFWFGHLFFIKSSPKRNIDLDVHLVGINIIFWWFYEKFSLQPRPFLSVFSVPMEMMLDLS